MARIRTIKPEFFGDEKLAPLAPIDRLVFLGLVSMADDAGRLLDNVKAIDGFIFPETEDSARDSLATLARLARITRYVSASGQKLIQVTNWSRHQKVDHAAKYVLPAPAEEVVAPPPVGPTAEVPSRDSRENGAKSSRLDLRPTTYDHGPTTSDQRPARESLDAAVADFLETCYPGANALRLERVQGDLAKARAVGVILRGGAVARAYDDATLARALSLTVADAKAGRIRDLDKAIVWALRKLLDTANEPRDPERPRLTVTEAASERTREQRDAEALEDVELRAAIATWKREHPEDFDRVQRAVARESARQARIAVERVPADLSELQVTMYAMALRTACLHAIRSGDLPEDEPATAEPVEPVEVSA
jgi:hypothetical protein